MKKKTIEAINVKKKRAHGVYAAILAGGIGSRFWPLSRETTPKQLLKVVGDESLLKSTIKRLAPLIKPEKVLIVTNERQAEIIRLHLAYEGEAGAPSYVVEPSGRNTAPAIGLAALRLFEIDPEAIMVVLPADHMIDDGARFRAALDSAVKAAKDGHLVTFGVVPTSPETGYGYIKSKKKPIARIDKFNIYPVERFVEKPDIKRAKGYLKAGGYLWNSGIFIWKASRILEEIKTHLPGIYKRLVDIKNGGDAVAAYDAMEPCSIDHGILEKAKDVVVIPASFPWSDMGSWNSFADVLETDKAGNVIKGRVVDIGSSNSIILGCERVVATIGLTDCIIVDTPDATLVCPRERAQEVKDIVSILKKKGFAEHELHRTVERPWGYYTVLDHGDGYKIKKIFVSPGRRLSLQSHAKRSEHWVVITGNARVQRGDETVDVGVNQSTYIPRGVKHRLENAGSTALEIIEVSSGEYIGEDDIVRYDDDFKRK